MWRVVFTKQAAKDAKKLKAAGLDLKAKRIISLMEVEGPFTVPPAFELLVGNLSGLFSRRTSIQHRLVYEVIPQEPEDGDGSPRRDDQGPPNVDPLR